MLMSAVGQVLELRSQPRAGAIPLLRAMTDTRRRGCAARRLRFCRRERRFRGIAGRGRAGAGGAKRVDLTGKTVIPALSNAHSQSVNERPRQRARALPRENIVDHLRARLLRCCGEPGEGSDLASCLFKFEMKARDAAGF